jgi:purine nucleosidase
MPMMRLVIDTDPGVDDAHALLMAFAQPQTRVEAVTTVAGNVSLPLTTANACTVLDFLAVPPEQTPVFAGCAQALLGPAEDAAWVHGDDGLGGSRHPPSSRPVSREPAALALIRLANQWPGELTLVALGPLTNLAVALSLDPDLPAKYQRLVVMGGAIRGAGNLAERPTTEFNAGVDPEAAAIVLERWPGLTLLSWEICLQYLLSNAQVEQLMSAGTPKAEFYRRITDFGYQRVKGLLDGRGMSAPDPLAMAVALQPDIVQRAERHAVLVELAGSHTRGQTSVDWLDRSGRDASVNLVLELDFERFWQMYSRAMV